MCRQMEKAETEDINNMGDTRTRDARKTGIGPCVKGIINQIERKATTISQRWYQSGRKLVKMNTNDAKGTRTGSSSKGEIQGRRPNERDQ